MFFRCLGKTLVVGFWGSLGKLKKYKAKITLIF